MSTSLIPTSKIADLEKKLQSRKLLPRDAKAQLAKEIVALYHGEQGAEKAEQEFERVFRERKHPSQMPKVVVIKKRLPLLDLLVKTHLVSSKSEARRLIKQKGVRIDDLVQDEEVKSVEVKKGMIIQVGKRKFVKIG